MPYQIQNLENQTRKVTQSLGRWHLLECMQDPSVLPDNAMTNYFMAKMGVRKRQVFCDIDDAKYPHAVLQAGAMQWMSGNVQVRTGVKGAGDMVGKMFRGAATGESAVKPEYSGQGQLFLEPTFKHIIFQDVSQWGPSGIVLEDGAFLACDGSLQQTLNRRSNFSSAAAGGEGLFNLCLTGQGVAVIESPVPFAELIAVDLSNDQLKIDGSYAVAWSGSLQFTVERTTPSLIGSAASGEGLVNVYRGTGRVLMCTTAGTGSMYQAGSE